MEQKGRKPLMATTAEGIELTQLGEPRETLDVVIDGAARRVTIYSRALDETWLLYTTVDDAGNILSSHQSLIGRLFSDDDLEQHYRKTQSPDH